MTSYHLESVVSVWNLLGRRDNKYKARIKITIHENGIDEFSRLVDERFALIRPSFQGFNQTLLSEISDAFAALKFERLDLTAFDARYLEIQISALGWIQISPRRSRLITQSQRFH